VSLVVIEIWNLCLQNQWMIETLSHAKAQRKKSIIKYIQDSRINHECLQDLYHD
jgi:hypothetical protein